MSYTCPHCQKVVKDLKQHIRRMHPDQGDHDQENDQEGQDFDVDTEDVETEEEAGKYHCVDCGKSVPYKADTCPNCGTQLDWGAL
ncbi:MAG: hypothetical protein KKD44_26140 [Proteobacteria bacterium]|nr:hypothetical protein [Patescibacteria group bacterium]MBU1173058.1 hypothetical protein [Pseudomonadota bacterium]